MLNDEIRYKIFTILQDDPQISQRGLAVKLGVSLGRVNFCLQALGQKGLIKVNNFRNNKNKKAYAYILTPTGIEEKARVTIRFLRNKLAEYDCLAEEIKQLRNEVDSLEQVGGSEGMGCENGD